MKSFKLLALVLLLSLALAACNGPQEQIAQLCANQPGCPEVTVKTDAPYTARFVTVPCNAPTLQNGTLPAGTKVQLEGVYELDGVNFARVIQMTSGEPFVVIVRADSLELSRITLPSATPPLCTHATY